MPIKKIFKTFSGTIAEIDKSRRKWFDDLEEKYPPSCYAISSDPAGRVVRPEIFKGMGRSEIPKGAKLSVSWGVYISPKEAC